jgi:YYY domain-containing protein
MTIHEVAPPEPAVEEMPAPPPVARRSVAPAIILGLLLLIGAYFRFIGLNWDDGKLLHPDELHVTDVITNRIHAPDLGLLFDPDRSPLNPRSVDPRALQPESNVAPRPRQFAYGSLPLFATDFVAWLWGKVTTENWNEFWSIFRVGRALTAFVDLMTILLAYGLARRAWGTTAGLLTAAFVTVATMHIQLAHFFVMDSWTAAFVTATLWATLVATRRGTPRAFALAGFLAGCAVATKATVVIIGFPLLVAAFLAALRPPDHAAEYGIDWTIGDILPRFLRAALIAGAAAGIAFFLFEPYAILNPTIYIRDIGEQSAIISGKLDVPYTRQYIGTLPLVYQAKNLVGWELGPLLGVTALAGFAWAGWRAVRRRSTMEIVLLSWVIPYLLLLALNEAKFPRYLLAISPILCGFAAKLLVDLGAFAPRAAARMAALPDQMRESGIGGWRRITATSVASIVLVGTFLTALAFSAIYRQPHTQIAASEWIYANIPKESSLSAEYWDRGIPLPLDGGRDPGFYGYKAVSFDFYSDTPACDRSEGKIPPEELCRPNNAATLEYLMGKLEDTDYLVEATNRIYGAIPHTPWRSPVQQQFFELLFAGRLGYSLAYEGTSFPSLGPLRFDDSFMDESFTVYDHPRVLIFKKDRQLSRDELRALFAPALARPLSPTRYPQGDAKKPLILTQLVDRLPVVADYGWNRTVGSNGIAAVLLWLLAIEVLGLLALPLTLWIFARFPDGGWGLSKAVGWLLFAYPIWLLASLRLGQFTLPYLLIVLGIGAALAALAIFRWRDHYRATLRAARPMIILSELVFLAAGGFFLSLRVRDPDLWHSFYGGEKPMELAHLNAILRSANFPPYDPWFADGTINYYYYGQYLVATLVKLTGIPVEIAFNLGLALVGGLIGATAFSVAGALAALALRRRARRGTIAAFSVLGTILFVGIGNLDGIARVLGRLRDGGGPPFVFDNFVWGGSRTIDGAITEFPYFSLLYADLHAHVIALPLTLLAIGIGVALAGRPMPPGRSGWSDTGATLRAFGPALALLAVTLGAVACTNSWDVPTYLLVTGAGLFHALGRGDRQLDPLAIIRRLALAAIGTLATGAGAYILYYPFFSHYKALFSQLARTRIPTQLTQYLDHFGLFLAIIMVVLIGGFLNYLPRRRGRSIILGGCLLALIAAVIGWRSTALTAWIADNTRLFGFGMPLPENTKVSGVTPALLAFCLVLLLTLWVLAWGETRFQMPLALLIAGVGVTLGPELVYVADNLQNSDFERMNTIFKFYMQGWSLFALGGLGALAWLWETAPRWSVAPFRRWMGRRDRRFNAVTLRGVLAGVLAILLCVSFTYPVIATPIRLNVRFPMPDNLGPTLNGYRWMEYGTVPNEYPNTDCGGYLSYADDYAAIQWLNTQIVGTPVLAEASIGPYRGNGSRFAINTGLPTILGWDNHETQQRPVEGIAIRSDDVRNLYNSTDEGRKLAILQRYHVSYIVVGSVERHWYYASPNRPPCADPYASKDGLAKLEGMAGRYLTPVFQSGETTIYRVLPAANSSGVAAGNPDTRPNTQGAPPTTGNSTP